MPGCSGPAATSLPELTKASDLGSRDSDRYFAVADARLICAFFLCCSLCAYRRILGRGHQNAPTMKKAPNQSLEPITRSGQSAVPDRAPRALLVMAQFIVMRSEHHGRSPRSTVDGADHADGTRNGGGLYPRHQRNPRSSSGWELWTVTAKTSHNQRAACDGEIAVRLRVEGHRPAAPEHYR